MKKIIYAVLVVVLIAATASITVWVMSREKEEPPVPSDVTTIPQEAYSQTIPGDSGEKMESESGGGSVNLTYSDQVRISTGEKLAYLMFSNPGRSNQNLTVQILVNGETIAQSGLILPGHKIEKLDLLSGAGDTLSGGEHTGNFRIQYYDPTTGEQAIVITEIPITVTVDKP